MGMNYYLHTGRKIKKICDLGCEHEIDEVLHVGKSSYGRYFAMHETVSSEGDVLDSLKAWEEYFEKKCPDGWFEDEDGTRVTYDFMKNCITRTGWKPSGNAAENFRPELIGKKVREDDSPGWFYGEYDVWGERGFVHSSIDKLGKDGLYVLVGGDFC